MTRPGTDSSPLRVAIIGSGPAGFYVADRLLKKDDTVVTVDMYDRLPVPFGLVRFGVAPDHEKIKNVTRVYTKTASNPRFRFFGNVEIGKHLTLDDLRTCYHQICYCTGAQTDRQMGIPGEDLERSHAATEFVAWYNGHPDYRDREFDLSVERVAVVGVGNVAVDVARILCRTPAELAKTDIADYALEALRGSRVKEVFMLGRRGPVQAAFTNPEVKELGELPGADIAVRAEEVALDALSERSLKEIGDKNLVKKIEILQSFVGRPDGTKPGRLTLRFLVSPLELLGNDAGQVCGMRLVRNELYETENGTLRPRPTEKIETLDVGMVFRSVGYRGVALDGLPFHDGWGVVPNEKGRVVDPKAERAICGLYVSGWIKRGPTGIIGTNKPDAAETVDCMLEDAAAGATLEPPQRSVAAAEAMVRRQQPDVVTWEDWLRLQELEEAMGGEMGRPRVKYTSVEEMLSALDGR